MKPNWKAVIRDSLMIYALTFFAGFIIALTGVEKTQAHLALTAVTATIVGFSISGAIAKHHRFKHLAWVALVLWVVSLLNIPLGGATITHWLLAIFGIFVWMGVGGALSYAFVRAPKSQEIPDYAAGHLRRERPNKKASVRALVAFLFFTILGTLFVLDLVRWAATKCFAPCRPGHLVGTLIDATIADGIVFLAVGYFGYLMLRKSKTKDKSSGAKMTDKETDELLKDSEDFGKFAQLIYRERRAAKSTIYTTWTLGIIVAVAGVIFYGWLWLWVLVVPVVVNALVVNNAYHRIARETGLDAMVVHQLWRQSKNINAQIEQKR